MVFLLWISAIFIFFGFLRGLYLMVQPGNHPGNIALRKYFWRRNHPDRSKTPWDP